MNKSIKKFYDFWYRRNLLNKTLHRKLVCGYKTYIVTFLADRALLLQCQRYSLTSVVTVHTN